MYVTQVNAVRALAQILRRYTSLNHLAQAARAVLQNSNQITQMLADINKVDFTSVQVRLRDLSLFCSLYVNLLLYIVDLIQSIYQSRCRLPRTSQSGGSNEADEWARSGKKECV